MVRLAAAAVGCKDRPEMGWMTTLAGTVPSGACRELPCEAKPGSPVSCCVTKLVCCNVCCRILGSI